MIRFLNLSDQITTGTPHFAFYDTVSNTILFFDDQQVFTSINHFIAAHKKTPRGPIERYLKLMPTDYFTSLIPGTISLEVANEVLQDILYRLRLIT